MSPYIFLKIHFFCFDGTPTGMHVFISSKMSRHVLLKNVADLLNKAGFSGSLVRKENMRFSLLLKTIMLKHRYL
jgi:hypothetical protein